MWVADESLSFQEDEPALLNREQSFLVGAMAFLECLASMIIDQHIDTLKHLRPFANLAKNQRIFPNPWTGVSTPLFITLAEVATLIRQKRKLSVSSSGNPQAESIPQTDVDITSHARRLFHASLSHRAPSLANMEETKDIKTPLNHLIGIDSVFRLIILLELTQIFPHVVLDDDNRVQDKTGLRHQSRRVSVDLATVALRFIAELPKTSGTLVMLSIPLVSAGSALQLVESYQSDYKLDSTSFSELHRVVSDLANRPLPLIIWREQVELRCEQMERRLDMASVRKTREILQAVWRRADETNPSEESSARANVHWMDVMIEEKLETLLG